MGLSGCPSCSLLLRPGFILPLSGRPFCLPSLQLQSPRRKHMPGPASPEAVFSLDPFSLSEASNSEQVLPSGTGRNQRWTPLSPRSPPPRQSSPGPSFLPVKWGRGGPESREGTVRGLKRGDYMDALFAEVGRPPCRLWASGGRPDRLQAPQRSQETKSTLPAFPSPSGHPQAPPTGRTTPTQRAGAWVGVVSAEKGREDVQLRGQEHAHLRGWARGSPLSLTAEEVSAPPGL